MYVCICMYVYVYYVCILWMYKVYFTETKMLLLEGLARPKFLPGPQNGPGKDFDWKVFYCLFTVTVWLLAVVPVKPHTLCKSIHLLI